MRVSSTDVTGREGPVGDRQRGKTSRQQRAWCWRNSEGAVWLGQVTGGMVVAERFRRIVRTGAGSRLCKALEMLARKWAFMQLR